MRFGFPLGYLHSNPVRIHRGKGGKTLLDGPGFRGRIACLPENVLELLPVLSQE
jgi:hypothetical protein